jgi:hypothetical protein
MKTQAPFLAPLASSGEEMKLKLAGFGMPCSAQPVSAVVGPCVADAWEALAGAVNWALCSMYWLAAT